MVFFADSHGSQFQSTHPVRGATDAIRHVRAIDLISIHAPREGCDIDERYLELTLFEFQSTHPVRGATRPRCATSGRWYFNPRTP